MLSEVAVSTYGLKELAVVSMPEEDLLTPPYANDLSA